jgi:hypothetical protein
MAIAFDAASGRATGTDSSVTLAHTCTGEELFLVVSIEVAPTFTCSGVTYNTVAMTQIWTGATPTVADRAYQFGLIAPATGNHNIVATFSGSNAYGISAASYSGVNQDIFPTDVATPVSEQATGTRLATVNVTNFGSWLVGGALITEDVSSDSVSGGVLRTSVKQTDVIDSDGVVGTGNQTLGYVWSSTDRHIFGAFALAPPPSSGFISFF